MARTNSLANFLTDVANAIRTKKGTETTIAASAFDTEILNLPSGTYQTKTLTISANGSQTITPDQGYDAIDEITITTQVPQKQLQTKSYNFTTNQTIQLTPDTGYDGFDIVTLNINVDPNAVNYQIYTAAYIGQNNTIQRDSTRYTTYKQIEIDLLPYINRTIIITNTGDRNFYGFTSVKPEGEVALNNPRQSTSGRLTYKYTGGNDRYLVYDFTTSNQSDSVINVELASAELIEKNITANGVYDAEDDDADGFSKVTVNVPSSQINNQDKTITQNGTYTADSGYTGLGEVTVNVPSGSGDVKLFDTVEHMQADSTAQEGDLAVVYRDATQPVQEDSEFSSCIFPNTVVLDEAFTGSVSERFRPVDDVWFNGRANMSSSVFRFTGYGESSDIRVQYTSQDGITYTRTDGGEKLQEFGVTIKWESMGHPFNSIIGNFMKIGGGTFEGLYEYTLNNKDVTKIRLPLLTDGEFDTANKKYNVTKFSVAFDVDKIVKLRDKIREDYGILTDTISGEFNVLAKNDKLVLLAVHNRSKNGSLELLGGIRYYSASKKFKIYSSYTFTGDVHEFVLDLDNMTYTDTVVGTQDGSGSSPYYFELDYEVQSFMCLLRYGSGYNKTLTNFEAWFQYDVSETYNATGIGSDYYDVYDAYIPIKSQLNTTDEYVYETTFYGKNGVENGTLTTNISSTFDDKNAEVYSKIMQAYDNMSPMILTDDNKEISKSIKLIPVKSNGEPLLDTSNVTDMRSMFSSCSSLTSIPLLDTKKVNAMSGMFNSCSNLTTIPLLDTSNVTDMSMMFDNCTSLTTISLLDTSNVTNMSRMFYNCRNLTTIPQLDTSNATNMYYMFYSCTSLTTIPQLNTSKVTDMGYMFQNCTSLQEIDLSGGTINSSASHNGIFYNVPTTCVIYVKDQASKTLLESWDNTHTYTIKTI